MASENIHTAIKSNLRGTFTNWDYPILFVFLAILTFRGTANFGGIFFRVLVRFQIIVWYIVLLVYFQKYFQNFNNLQVKAYWSGEVRLGVVWSGFEVRGLTL